MAIIKCKMCGGDIELSEDKTFGVCEYCGSTMTLPKVDGEQTAAAFNRGNHFRRIGEFDKALAVYEHIVELDDSNAEAHWCCALCRFGIEYVEDPDTHDYLPTCHRASFDSILEDVDYLAALEHSDGVTRKQYEKDGHKIAQVQKGVLAVSQKEEPFDVFLCYKETEETGERTRDSVLAQEIYYELTEQGRRVFFARVTLENKGGAEYEPYIFAALHSAKVMVVLGTKAEHFNGTWVKNEWSRFLAMMKQDRSKLLIPCYRDMDPYDLPDQLSPLQAYDMGKIGFLQDLTHGINKVLDAGKEKEEAPKETVVVQSESGNLSALLQRGELALEDGEWQKADEFFEQALNLDADEPRAYLGKFLAQQEEPNLESLVRSRELVLLPGSGVMEDAFPEDQETIEHTISQYSIDSYCPPDMIRNAFTFNRKYQNDTSRWESLYQKEASFWEGNKLFQRALEFSQGEFRETLKQAHDRPLAAIRQKQEEDRKQDEAEKEQILQAYREHVEKAKQNAAQWNQEARELQAKDYETACELEETAASDAQLRKAQEIFSKLKTYQDSQDHAQAIEEKLKDLREAAAAQLRQEQERVRTRNIRILIGVIAGVVLALVIYLLATKLIIPNSRYSKAETLLENKDYRGAVELFETIENYKDSAGHLQEARYNLAKELIGDDFDLDAPSVGVPEVTSNFVTDLQECPTYFCHQDFKEAAVLFGLAGTYKDASSYADVLWQAVGAGNRLTISGDDFHNTAVITGGTVSIADGSTKYCQCDTEDWEDIVAIASGGDFTMGLKSDGTVVSTGSLYYMSSTKSWSNIVGIAADGSGLVAGLKSDGTVVVAGTHENDQNKKKAENWNNIVAVAVEQYFLVGLKTDGTVVTTNEDKTIQNAVRDWTDIVAIAAGDSHIVGLKSDGTVVAVSSESYSSLSEDPTAVKGWKNVVAISAGNNHTVGLRANGSVVGTGYYAAQCEDLWKYEDIQTIYAHSDYTLLIGEKNAYMLGNFLSY